MIKRVYWLGALFTLLFAGAAVAQEYPMMNIIADRMVEKYQKASCADLWKRKGEAKTDEEKNMLQLLHDDPQMRSAFINKVAAPIVNKMFECDLIP